VDLKPKFESARAQIAETFERLKPNRPAPRRRMRAQPRGWMKSGLVALRRQWQPMVAAAIVLGIAGMAWWLRNVEVWPHGPFERLTAAATAGPLMSPNARPGQGALAPAGPKTDTRAAAEKVGQFARLAATAPAQPQTAPAAEADGPTAPPQPETSSDPLIAEVQAELKRLGLFEGEIDGVSGQRLRSAITAAVTKLKLGVQSFPSKRLLARLKSQPTAEASTVPVSAPTPVAAAPEMKPAEPKRTVNPEYPHGALNRQLEGWVEVAYDVDPQGHVQNVRVSEAESERATKLFGSAALKAVEATSFFPATADGKPVWSRDVKRRFRFAIKGR
jgi:TonB family protein